MPFITLREVYESTPDGTPDRHLVLEALNAPNAPGPMDSMPVEVGDQPSPEEKIREGLLAALGAFAAQADGPTLRRMISVAGMPDSISEMVGGLHTGGVPEVSPEIPDLDDHAPVPGGAVEEEEAPEPPMEPGPGGMGDDQAMPQPAAESGEEPPEMPDDEDAPKGSKSEDEELPADEAAESPETQEEEDEDGKEKHKRPFPPKQADESAPLSGEIVLECVGLFAEQGLKPERSVIEAAARLSTTSARRTFVESLLNLIPQGPAPMSQPRSAPGTVAESAAQTKRTVEEIEAEYRKPGSFRI